MPTLAVKYRPRTFDDVVEQGVIKKILQDQLVTKTTKNCYLFTGGAGTGKTTCARIFANEINDHKGNPIEIDAASNNGVENVREIIDQSKFKALDAPYKIYIIDECHMLSTGAWNAMLKLLEEPPAQTIFIMCTTDPQKIPATILSRVQRYDFQRITFKSVVSRLEYIMTKEQILDYELGALEYVAKIADGGMRDAITLLDKCLSYSSLVTLETIIEALGVANYESMFNLTNYILGKDSGKATIEIEELYRSGVDLKQFMKQYNWFLLDAMKYFLIGDFEYLTIPSTYQDQLDEWTDDQYYMIQDLLKIINQLNADIKWEQAPKQMIEATIIVMSLDETI